MKKRLSILILCCLYLNPIEMVAEKVIVKTDEKWKEENERSISLVPQISIDEQHLYICSQQQLNNLNVCIRDFYGCVVYSDTLVIQAGETIMIPVASFNEGEYTLLINQESRYVIATILIT